MLDRCRVELGADAIEHRLATDSIVAEHPDLDQLVRLQREIHFLYHLVGEAFGADHHDRVELVGTRPEFFALGWAQHE